MIVWGTVLESKPIARTVFGPEYRVQWDANPDAKSMDGRAGTALGHHAVVLQQGDRVMLEYRVGPGHFYGLWFIAAKLENL
jgi:hypothetical protein